jgi:heme-degrading monooxygenase HmoA
LYTYDLSIIHLFRFNSRKIQRGRLWQGYISGETLVSADDDCELIVISTWHKMEDWINWKESEERKTIDAQLEELQEKPTVYEPFVFSKYRLAAKAGFPEPL